MTEDKSEDSFPQTIYIGPTCRHCGARLYEVVTISRITLYVCSNCELVFGRRNLLTSGI